MGGLEEEIVMLTWKRNFLALFFAAAFLLSACNLSVVTPETPLVASPTLSVAPTYSPTPSATFTVVPVTLTASLTLAPTETLSPSLTPSPTPQWSVCPGIVVTRIDSNDGDTLHILRCEDGLEYDLGPLAKGAYAVAPNDKFLAYVTVNGMIYAARIGDRYVVTVFNLATERIFTALNKKINGDFKLSFTGDELNYQLIVYEKKYNQKRVYELPFTITRQ